MSPSVDELNRNRGFNLRLRLVKPEDANYIHSLRTNKAYNSHLSTVTGTAEDQRAWIETYKMREAEGSEYYFVIERLDGLPCGVVRLYEITEDCFTWGSWILDSNKPAKAALEVAYLVYRLAFEVLGLDKAVFDVVKKNERVLVFHQRFGAIETGADEKNVYFEYRRDQFSVDSRKLVEILKAQTRL